MFSFAIPQPEEQPESAHLGCLHTFIPSAACEKHGSVVHHTIRYLVAVLLFPFFFIYFLLFITDSFVAFLIILLCIMINL